MIKPKLPTQKILHLESQEKVKLLFTIFKIKCLKQVLKIDMKNLIRKNIKERYWTKSPGFLYSLFFSFCFSKLHFTVEMQSTLVSYGSILLGTILLRHHLLTLHWTENHPFYRHELLPNETLAAAGAQEALCGRVPAEVVIGHPLHFGINGIVASLTYLLSQLYKEENKMRDLTVMVTFSR